MIQDRPGNQSAFLCRPSITLRMRPRPADSRQAFAHSANRRAGHSVSLGINDRPATRYTPPALLLVLPNLVLPPVLSSKFLVMVFYPLVLVKASMLVLVVGFSYQMRSRFFCYRWRYRLPPRWCPACGPRYSRRLLPPSMRRRILGRCRARMHCSPF